MAIVWWSSIVIDVEAISLNCLDLSSLYNDKNWTWSFGHQKLIRRLLDIWLSYTFHLHFSWLKKAQFEKKKSIFSVFGHTFWSTKLRKTQWRNPIGQMSKSQMLKHIIVLSSLDNRSLVIIIFKPIFDLSIKSAY